MITKQTKIIGGIATALFLAVLVCLVAGVFIITAQGEQLESQIALLADVSEQERKFNDAKQVLSDSLEERQALDELFLTEGETITFLTSIEQVAQQQGLELTTESLKVEEPDDGPATLNIVFTFLGQENVVNDFIEMLETLPYGSYLTSLQLQNNQETGTAEAQVTVVILLLPQYD